MKEITAFPITTLPETDIEQEGMSLRDYFAGQAIVGVVARDEYVSNFEAYAKEAYVMADAMMKERSKTAKK